MGPSLSKRRDGVPNALQLLYSADRLTADEAHPAFRSEHFRLQLTDWALVGGHESIVTAGGLICSPAVAREAPAPPRAVDRLRRL